MVPVTTALLAVARRIWLLRGPGELDGNGTVRGRIEDSYPGSPISIHHGDCRKTEAVAVSRREQSDLRANPGEEARNRRRRASVMRDDQYVGRQIFPQPIHETAFHFGFDITRQENDARR